MNTLTKILIPTAVTFFCFTASAGWRPPYPISISTSSQFASGAMGSVRADNTHSKGLIGCTVEADLFDQNPATDTLSIFCRAEDGTNSASCANYVTPTSPMLKVVQSITSNSFVYFTYDPNQHDLPGIAKCTLVEVVTGSIFYPITL